MKKIRAIILAAGRGKRLQGLTDDPKCLLKVNKEALITRYLKLLNSCGIKEVTVVVGYRANKVSAAIKRCGVRVDIIKNPKFCQGSILSLWAAREYLKGEVMIMDGDLYFEHGFIRRAATSRKGNLFLIDRKSAQDGEAVIVGFRKNRAAALARGLKGNYPISGEWAGLLKLSAHGALELKRLLERLVSQKEDSIGYEFIIPLLFKKVPISYELVDDLEWVEIDFPKDFKKALKLGSN